MIGVIAVSGWSIFSGALKYPFTYKPFSFNSFSNFCPVSLLNPNGSNKNSAVPLSLRCFDDLKISPQLRGIFIFSL
jgi:hypothetical protein